MFFTSDSHFGHEAVLGYSNRPFSSIEEHDETLIINWNKRIGPKDIVYHLGDLTFHKPESSLTLLKRLNGRIHLVRGNHDRDETLKVCADRFVWVKDLFNLRWNKQFLVLCHFPMLRWNRGHYGSWMTHGHSHSGLQRENETCLRLDVGIDVHNYKPIHITEVKAIMEAKQVVLSKEEQAD